MHYVYLLESTVAPGLRHVGCTDELQKRLRDHNAGKFTSTARHRPWSLRNYAVFHSRQQALEFESRLKSRPGHAFSKTSAGTKRGETENGPDSPSGA